MRLGGPVFGVQNNPESWAEAVKRSGYRAAYCPVENDASDQAIKDYVKVAAREDIIIAEVGAWSNPLSPDKELRDTAVLHCKKQLELAEKIGARCCVNIAGSRGEQWDGHHPDNYSDETFEMIVETVRCIIDSVKPECTFYTLETMPWMYPDSADSYLKLIRAIDRRQFAVHLDPINIINSPKAYYNNSLILKECFEKLGPYIKSCHAKDIMLTQKLTVHLEEVVPGQGIFDYGVYLSELSRLDADIPLMIEHLPTEEEYMKAAEYIRKEAAKLNVKL